MAENGRMRRIIVADQDQEYALRFAEGLRRLAGNDWQISAFDAEAASAAASGSAAPGPASLGIVPEELRDNPPFPASAYMYLAEEESGDPAVLGRYRPLRKQLRQIRQFLEGQEGPDTGSGRTPARVFGVFLPGGGPDRSALAFLLAQIASEKGECLYLDLERYPEELPLRRGREEGDLADLLYLARVGGNIPEKAAGICCEYAGVSVIEASRSAEDIRSASETDWTLLTEALRSAGDFAYIVFNIGDGPADESWLMRRCDRIFVPEGQNASDRSREESWRKRMAESGHGEVLGRVRSLAGPDAGGPCRAGDLAAYLYTEWGHSVRAAVETEFGL